jgi:hypothetical protein
VKDQIFSLRSTTEKVSYRVSLSNIKLNTVRPMENEFNLKKYRKKHTLDAVEMIRRGESIRLMVEKEDNWFVR